MPDSLLMRYTPGPTVEVAPAVLDARSALGDAAADLLAVPDSALETLSADLRATAASVRASAAVAPLGASPA